MVSFSAYSETPFARVTGKSLAIAALTFALLADTAGLAAGATDQVSLKYNVHSGGLKIFKISLKMEMNDTDYSLSASIKSKGLINLFDKTKIGMSVSGKTAGARIRPTSYHAKTKSNGRKRDFSLSWDAKRFPHVKRSYTLSTYKSNQLKRSVRPGMVDPLSHLLRFVLQNDKKPCTGSELVYNGKTVAEFRYSYLGTSTLNKKTGGAYRGRAIKCRLDYQAVAGLSVKKQKAQDKEPPVFTIWYAPISIKGRNLILPVAVNGKIAGRAIKMRLSAGSVSGKPLAN